MNKLQKILGVGLIGLGLTGCSLLQNANSSSSSFDDGKRHWANISYIVEGNGVNKANSITYGRYDTNWVEGFYTNKQNVSLPWQSATGTTCTGHKVRLGVSGGSTNESAILTLKIKDDGKVVAQKSLTNNSLHIMLGNLEYYIPSQ